MKNFINSSPGGTKSVRGSTWQAILLGALLAASVGAQAAGTAAGADITNIARLTYDVSGTPQGPICSSDTGNSTADTNGTCADDSGKTTFRVDNKVDVLVTQSSGTATSVVAGQPVAVTTFTVTNQGNKTQDFALFTANLANGSQVVSGVVGSPFTDNFDATGCTVAMTGTTGAATFSSTGGDHLDALVADEVATVTVTCAIPAAQANGSAAVVYLGATAHTNDGAATLGGALTQSGSNGVLVEDTLFADDAGSDDTTITADPDGLRDATHSARGVFVVATSALTVTKTVTTVCDPLNGQATPFNIPGALVRWSVTVANAPGAGSSATLQNISDALSVNTTFDADFEAGASAANCAAAANSPVAGGAVGSGFRVSCTATVGGTRACDTADVFYTTTSSVDGVDLNGSTVDVDFDLVLPSEAGHNIGELKAGESVTVDFQVFIN